MKKYSIILVLALIFLPIVSLSSYARTLAPPFIGCCFGASNKFNYENISLADDYGRIDRDAFNGIPTCCPYTERPEECYSCFEQKASAYSSYKSKQIWYNIFVISYIVALFILGILLLINKIKKEKILSDKLRKILFWIFIILVSITLLFIFLFSLYYSIT